MIHEALINWAETGIIRIEHREGKDVMTKAKTITETKDGVIYKYGIYEEHEGMTKDPLLLSVQFDAQRFTIQRAQDYLNSVGINATFFEEFIPKEWALSTLAKGKNGRYLKPKFLSVGKNLYKKDVIRTGHYEHPEANWTLDVDEGKMLGWVESFHAMQENGVDVEVVVDHSLKADDVRGLVTDLEVVDDELVATLELTDEGQKTVANVKNVSVCIEPDVKDGMGREYGEAITHIALVQKPVVPGQRDFVPIAASRVAPLMLSIVTPKQESNDMEIKEFIEKLGKRLNLSLVAEDAEKSIDAIAEAMTPETEPEKKLETPEAVYEQVANVNEQRLSLLVEKGKLSPAAKEKALSLLGEKGKRNKMMLSLDSDGKCGISDLCEILECNTVVETGEKKLFGLSNPNEKTNGVLDAMKSMM